MSKAVSDKAKIKKELEEFSAKRWKDIFAMWLNWVLDLDRVGKGAFYEEDFNRLLYESGRMTGKRSWGWLSANLKLGDRGLKEKTLYTDVFWSITGVGEIEFLKEGGKRILRFKGGTFFSRATAIRKKKICHWVAGFIAGMTEDMVNLSFKVTEIKCVSNGDKSCDFLIEPAA